ncbi:hypothetical protein [Thiohalorhabdus methylotrophus]|uniref:Uncharacterized protein n=1 Tax=Thiohalorhabdus methylotrophus TaxID=3242694 RepID=A0ABV4TZY0_9GAMM
MTFRALAGLLLLLMAAFWAAPARSAPEIQGVYSLKLGQTRDEAKRALSEDEHFRRIAARFFQGFPLYEVTLGGYQLYVHPRFQDGKLVEIALQFRDQASPNDVGPVIHDQLRFALDTLQTRFGEPDRTFLEIEEIGPRDFENDERVVTHQWSRKNRVAQLLLWQEGFTYGAEIVLAEEHAREPQRSPAEAF